MVFHRIYESVELGSASFDHQPPSKLVAPVTSKLLFYGSDERRSNDSSGWVCSLLAQPGPWRSPRPRPYRSPPLRRARDRGRVQQAGAFLDDDELVSIDWTDGVGPAARPGHADAGHTACGTNAKGQRELALRGITRPGLHDLAEAPP